MQNEHGGFARYQQVEKNWDYSKYKNLYPSPVSNVTEQDRHQGTAYRKEGLRQLARFRDDVLAEAKLPSQTFDQLFAYAMEKEGANGYRAVHRMVREVAEVARLAVEESANAHKHNVLKN
jgi:hypothetical protein